MEGKITGLTEEIGAIQVELQAGIEQLDDAFDPAALPLETEALKPAKTDVKVRQVALLWLLFDARGERAW